MYENDRIITTNSSCGNWRFTLFEADTYRVVHVWTLNPINHFAVRKHDKHKGLNDKRWDRDHLRWFGMLIVAHTLFYKRR